MYPFPSHPSIVPPEDWYDEPGRDDDDNDDEEE
jgi:hypothetical protein